MSAEKVESMKVLCWIAPFSRRELSCQLARTCFRLIINCRDKLEQVTHSQDPFAPVGYLKILQYHLEAKEIVPLATPITVIQQINGATVSNDLVLNGDQVNWGDSSLCTSKICGNFVYISAQSCQRELKFIQKAERLANTQE